MIFSNVQNNKLDINWSFDLSYVTFSSCRLSVTVFVCFLCIFLCISIINKLHWQKSCFHEMLQNILLFFYNIPNICYKYLYTFFYQTHFLFSGNYVFEDSGAKILRTSSIAELYHFFLLNFIFSNYSFPFTQNSEQILMPDSHNLLNVHFLKFDLYVKLNQKRV